MRCVKRLARAFALYEVLLGVSDFQRGSAHARPLDPELSECNRSQFGRGSDAPDSLESDGGDPGDAGIPDKTKETKIDTGFGEMKRRKVRAAGLKGRKGFGNSGIFLVI